MRKIKFKARHWLTGKWCYGDIVQSVTGVLLYDSSNTQEYKANQANQVRPDTVCQFTGFTDGLDREIYEGDVLRSDLPPFSYIEGKVCEMDYHYAVITWQEECGAFVLKAHKNRDSSLLGSHNGEGSFLSQKTLKKFFIMGNINEHEWQERLNIINRRGL